jgi:hypothetical protein
MVAAKPSLVDAVIDFSVKGTLFRGPVLVLRQQGKLAAVEAKLSGATLTMARELPSTTSWIDGRNLVELERGIHEALGDRGLREVARKCTQVEIGPLTRSITDGIIRLFGATPQVMFQRVSMFDPLVTKGSKTSWVATGPSSGEVRLTYATSRGLPDVMGEFSAGMLESTFDFCRVEGTVRFAGWTSDARNESKLEVRW